MVLYHYVLDVQTLSFMNKGLVSKFKKILPTNGLVFVENLHFIQDFPFCHNKDIN